MESVATLPQGTPVLAQAGSRGEASFVDGVGCPTAFRCLFVGEYEDFGNAFNSDTLMYFAREAPPATPVGLRVRAVGTAAVISWQLPTDPFTPPQHYVVTQLGGGGLPGQGTAGTDPLSTRCVVRGLRPHVRYGFSVAAVNSTGRSARTATEYVTIP
jgi:hypothetical protein